MEKLIDEIGDDLRFLLSPILSRLELILSHSTQLVRDDKLIFMFELKDKPIDFFKPVKKSKETVNIDVIKKTITDNFDKNLYVSNEDHYKFILYGVHEMIIDDISSRVLMIIFSYEKYQHVLFYYDFLPEEIRQEIIIKYYDIGSDDRIYKDILNIFRVKLDLLFVYRLLQAEYPTIYGIIKSLDMLDEVSIETYENLETLKYSIIKDLDYFPSARRLYDIDEYKLLQNIETKNGPHSDNSLILNIIICYHNPKICTYLKDKFIQYNLNPIYEYITETGPVTRRLPILHEIERDMIKMRIDHIGYDISSKRIIEILFQFYIVELVRVDPVFWLYILSHDFSSLPADDKKFLDILKIVLNKLKTVQVEPYEDIRDYSFHNSFLEKIKRENVTLYNLLH